MSALKRVFHHFVLLPLRSGKLLRTLLRVPLFVRQWRQYGVLSHKEVAIADWHPCLDDVTSTTPFDPHYFYQSAWAAAKISAHRPGRHVDIGSQVDLIAPLTGFVEVEFVDVRPLMVSLPRLRTVKGSLLQLPYPNSSVESLSSLHVIEHIGLGRYGDPLDPQGSAKACKELQRVLARGGHLYISVPIGRERVEFNGHRVHAPDSIMNYFRELTLVDYACVDDKGVFREHAHPEKCMEMNYGLGLFHFTKHMTK